MVVHEIGVVLQRTFVSALFPIITKEPQELQEYNIVPVSSLASLL